MTEERISELVAMGFKRWTKGAFDRLYINPESLGLECTYYKTGNVRGATFCGMSISNSEARRMKYAKTYIDIKTGTVYSDHQDLKEAAEKLMEA